MKFPQAILNAAQAVLPQQPVAAHGELADVLKIKISLCDKEGNPLADQSAHEDFDKQVVGILTEGDFQLESQYQSPFENSNPEQRLPTLMGMIQSGEFLSLGASIGLINTSDDPATSFAGQMLQNLGDKAKEVLESLEGRTNFTKLNSTQIYVSTSPARISGTIFFSAWRDAKTEVNQQIALLQKWALPVELYAHSLAQSVLDPENQGVTGLFPSKIPPYVAVDYGGRSYVPMIIENIAEPLVVPMTSDGGRLAIAISITFASRQAWDASNINKLYGYSS